MYIVIVIVILLFFVVTHTYARASQLWHKKVNVQDDVEFTDELALNHNGEVRNMLGNRILRVSHLHRVGLDNTTLLKNYASIIPGIMLPPICHRIHKRLPRSGCVKGCRPFSTSRNSTMRIFGHRGASAVYPENTRVSFEQAFRLGAAGVECDLQMLADGTIVVLHDDTLSRTAVSGSSDAALLDTPVSKLTWEQVKDVDIGSWKDVRFAGERLLRFDEFLLLVNSFGGSCLVEIKGKDHAIIDNAVSAALKSTLPSANLHWIGFDIEVMGAIKRRLPNYKTYYVVEPLLEDNSQDKSNLRSLPLHSGKRSARAAEARRLCDEAVAAGLDGIDFYADPTLVERPLLEYARDRGLDVGVWVWRRLPGCDTRKNWQTFHQLGIDFFTSDLPPTICAWMSDGDSRDELLSQTSQDVISIATFVLIALFAGSGVTFTVLCFCLNASTAGEGATASNLENYSCHRPKRLLCV